MLLLQIYMGTAWACGCLGFGILGGHRSAECRIARQYLCQTAGIGCSIVLLAFISVERYNGYVLFVWVYGIFCGGYHYSLKIYTYERVRARNFPRAWSFVQFSQAIPTAIGVPISGKSKTNPNNVTSDPVPKKTVKIVFGVFKFVIFF